MVYERPIAYPTASRSPDRQSLDTTGVLPTPHTGSRDWLTGASITAQHVVVIREYDPTRPPGTRWDIPRILHRGTQEFSGSDPDRLANAPRGREFSAAFTRYLRPVVPAAQAEERGWLPWYGSSYVMSRLYARMGKEAFEAALAVIRDRQSPAAVAARCGRGLSWVLRMRHRALTLADGYYRYSRHVTS